MLAVVHVIDASGPAAPVEIGSYDPGSSGGGANLTAVGGYLFMAEAGRGGLTILDISRPSAPRPIVYYGTLGSPSGLALDAGAGYVADGEGGLLVLGFDLPPTLQLNHRTGAPGSYLNLRGTDFGPSATVILAANATELGALQATARGLLTATLTTDAADEGLYFVRAIFGERAGVEFTLHAAARGRVAALRGAWWDSVDRGELSGGRGEIDAGGGSARNPRA
jgi:hypothetical protein